jgi:hypothetical protein
MIEYALLSLLAVLLWYFLVRVRREWRDWSHLAKGCDLCSIGQFDKCKEARGVAQTETP